MSSHFSLRPGRPGERRDQWRAGNVGRYSLLDLYLLSSGDANTGPVSLAPGRPESAASVQTWCSPSAASVQSQCSRDTAYGAFSGVAVIPAISFTLVQSAFIPLHRDLGLSAHSTPFRRCSSTPRKARKSLAFLARPASPSKAAHLLNRACGRSLVADFGRAERARCLLDFSDASLRLGSVT